MKKALKNINLESTNRIIEMAWEDRTPFEVIEKEFSITHGELIAIMRSNLKPSSFKLWRKRVNGRKTKHGEIRSFKVGRHRCERQGKLGR
jgi:uncharacterized protein (TIGR03643 family)|tara:strand:- start:668 stop:937 length:270 start_codon:yes stop_codon:yes gene_type:complete